MPNAEGDNTKEGNKQGIKDVARAKKGSSNELGYRDPRIHNRS